MTRLSPASLVMTAALGLAVLGVVVVSTVRAAAPANAPPQEPLALAPSDPPQELVKPTIELKLTTGLTRHKDGRPIKFTIEATNRAKTPQQIAFGLVDQGVTLEVRDAQGKVVAPEIGHSLRSLPTNEYVASLFPVLAPGETRKLDLSAARRDSCLVVYDLLFGRLVFNLPEGDCTIRAVLSQTELPQEKYRGHVDEKVWWKGTTQSAPLSLALAAADEGKEKAPEIREEGVVQKGLSVTVKPLRASFVEQEAMQFLVTFKNVSKEDFTFLNTPKNYLNWKFHFRDVASGSEWLAVNTAKREGFTDELAVLKAGESLEVTARVDSGFLFRREGPQDGKEGPRRDLLAGKYQLAIEIVCQGATLQRRIVPVPPLWVGEIKTKAVPFAIEKKPAGENPQGAAVVPQANRAEAGEWSVTLTSTGGNLFPGAVKIQIDVKAGKGKATRTHTPPGNPPQETPSLKEVVLSEEAVMVLEKSLEKLKAWELGDLHAPALDAPDYAVALKRGAKTHTIKMEGAKDSHLDLILAIQQCFAKGTAR